MTIKFQLMCKSHFADTKLRVKHNFLQSRFCEIRSLNRCSVAVDTYSVIDLFELFYLVFDELFSYSVKLSS